MKNYLLTLRILCFIVLVGCTIVSMAQEVRYVKTDYIDKDGNRLGAGAGGVRILNFTGQRIVEKVPSIGGHLTLTWQFHHRDGSNSVYYTVAYDAFYRKESLNPDGVIVVSSDRRLINIIQYFRGQRQYTEVYYQKDPDRYDTMAR